MRRFLLLAGLVAALAGCGGGDDGGDAQATQAETTPGSGAASQTLRADADPSGALRFTTESLQANAGEVTLIMENPSPIPHNIAVKGNGVDEKGEVVEKGGQSEVSATVEPGTYEFYCSVPGHEEAGMRGELVVS
ncbi:MAG: plastocyanin/azurin family copper-binding protein [Actinomycetota bacterium]|nr:plastocyanin/azurin family copper-binding protein [Actinomycetota bacterium]